MSALIHKYMGYSKIMQSVNKILLMSILVSTPILSSNIYAQTTSDQQNAAIITYDQQYFQKYAPVTLLDMLQRVPGVPEILNNNRQQRRGGGGAQNRGERGFGSGGDQILIDGKRLAGKANNIDDTLQRISASQVEKVELIRGAASGLDVQSQGLVINIILKEGTSTSTTFWKITSETKLGHDPGLEFLLSHSGSKGNLDYTFSGERTSNNGFFDRSEQFFDPSDNHTGDQEIEAAFRFRGYKFNTNLTYNFENNSVLRLNGLFEPRTMNGDEFRIETGDDPDNIFWDTTEDTDKWEVGGDYTRRLGSLGNLKALFVINRNKRERVVDRFTGAEVSQFQNVKDTEHEDKTEKILRASLTRNLTEKQSIEFGGELAINTFDKKFDKLDREFDGDLFDLISSDNVEIQENRYEIFANHSYNISAKIVLQSSITTEFSNIIADNIFADGNTSRRDTNFTYLKPRINLRYDITGSDQLRFTVEKKVSQLNFNNFVTRFDQRTEEIRLGNTNIRPEQIWEFSLAYEHRLANDSGSLELEIFHREYKDHISRVDFTEYEDFSGNPIGVEEFFALSPDIALRDLIDFTTKSGNIDKATANGLKVKTNLRLGFIGLEQATLSTSYIYERRRTTGQFIIAERNFDRSSDHTLNIDFRHDMTDLGLSYGGRASFRSDMETFDIARYWPTNPQANLSLFAEYNIFNGIKMRLDAKQLTGKRGTSTEFNFVDHIRFNELSRRTEKQSTVSREVEISLQGTF